MFQLFCLLLFSIPFIPIVVSVYYAGRIGYIYGILIDVIFFMIGAIVTHADVPILFSLKILPAFLPIMAALAYGPKGIIIGIIADALIFGSLDLVISINHS